MSKIYFVLILLAVSLLACSKKKDSTPSADIKIISLTTSVNPVKVFDTAVITMEAVGDNLLYTWKANHGKLKGSGKIVKYSACYSCIGLNTITCTLSNSTGAVSDTVMIRVLNE
ncbi:MAG: hypothetical protein NTU51_04785 [Bacteroidetes bacterium]|nr:hypothetical protein [Bacteroidota bacterium]